MYTTCIVMIMKRREKEEEEELGTDGRSTDAAWAWSPMPTVIAFRRWRQEEQLVVTIGYI